MFYGIVSLNENMPFYVIFSLCESHFDVGVGRGRHTLKFYFKVFFKLPYLNNHWSEHLIFELKTHHSIFLYSVTSYSRVKH